MKQLGQLAPWLLPYARWLVNQYAPFAGARSVRITSVLRSRAQQQELWANRHTNPYPVAPPGTSMHELGRAFDIVTDPYDVLFELGPAWQSIGGVWGGKKDPIHFHA